VAAEVAMSWSFDCATFFADGFGDVYTVRVDGARWFAVVNKGKTALVAAPASENDGECRPTNNDAKIARLIAFARSVEMLPRAFARHELDTWCEGGGYGELVYIKIDRALLASAFDVLEAATPEPDGVPDPDWYIGVTHAGMPHVKEGDPEVAAVLKAGDAFAVVMGLRDRPLPPAVFP